MRVKLKLVDLTSENPKDKVKNQENQIILLTRKTSLKDEFLNENPKRQKLNKNEFLVSPRKIVSLPLREEKRFRARISKLNMNHKKEILGNPRNL